MQSKERELQILCVGQFEALGLQHPIIIALLGSTYESRFTDMIKLVHAAQISNGK